MPGTLNVLIVEDSDNDAMLTLLALRRAGYGVEYQQVDTAEKLRDALGRQTWDLVISDFSMPHFSGGDALRVLQESGLDVPFIIVSGAIGEERAVEIMKAGAHDYVMKNDLTRLAPAVRRELREAEERRARRQAEEQVDLLSRAVSQSTSMIMLTDIDGIITYVNPTFCRITGYEIPEVIGRHSRLLKSASMPDAIFDQLWGTIVSGQTWWGELVNRKKDGQEYAVEVRISAIRNSSDIITGFLSVQEDISERLRLQAELQRYTAQLEQMVEERTAQLRMAKEQIEVILNNTSDALALSRPDGTLQTVNPAFETLFGNRATETIDRILKSVTAETRRMSVSNTLRGVMANHENARIETQIIAADGTTRDIDLALIAVQVAGEQSTGVLLSARDITHSKEIERFKARFVANAVHDLSTPVTALRVRLHLLKHTPDKLTYHVKSLENQVDHLQDLLTDLRTLSQLDRHELVPQRESVNLNALAQRVFDTYEPVAYTRQQKLDFVPASTLPDLLIDRRQCERVLINLVSNAINYTPDGKDIRIATFASDSQIGVEVVDQGIGIAPADLPYIFDRFYRADPARDLRASGSGLGLSIVREFVELNGGTVGVVSEPGHGTTFTVHFPSPA